MYEMMTGKELSDVVPSDHEYGYIQDKESSDVLKYVFKRRESGEFKRTIKKVNLRPRNHVMCYVLIFADK